MKTMTAMIESTGRLFDTIAKARVQSALLVRHVAPATRHTANLQANL